MADEVETPQIRPSDLVTVTVLRINSLKNPKGDPLSIIVRIEFGDRLLGDSPKQECSPDIPAEFNFSVNLPCTYSDPVCLDDITHKPVVVTVMEVLAKERRQKEEKMNILGQCCVDLLPLLQGEVEINQSLQINSVTEPTVDATSSDLKPTIDLRVVVNEPILDETQLSGGTLMTLSVGSLYSLPESWSVTAAQCTFVVSVPVPITKDREVPIIFDNGKLKPAQDKEPHKKQKKWAMPGTARGNAAYLPGRYLFSDPIEQEDGDFTDKDDLDHRKTAEQEKNRVTWNMERRCFLQSSGVKSFQDSIAKHRYWPAEVTRLAQVSTVKAKKDEDIGMSYRGVAFLNLTPLLYPGVTRVKGAYKVVGYSDAVLYEKTKRKSGISEEAIKQTSSMLSKLNKSPSLQKGSKEPAKDVKRPDTASQQPAQAKLESVSETETQLQPNSDGQQYTDAKSYVMIEICLDKPLVPKRTPEALAKKVAEVIPPRPLYPLRTDRAQKAVEDFHSQVAIVAGTILEEFRRHFIEELSDCDMHTPEAMEERRQVLVYELNSSGKYFAIKEQLKHSVVKIVREKYLRTTDFENQQELQTFLSELYVYLIDQMHVSLNKFLALEDQPPVPKPLTDSNQLKHFAREAEVNQNFDLAATYYKERIARDRNDANCWFDFGTFNLFINDITKAEECFKECLSINQKHLNGMLMYGVVCMLGEKTEPAETFFEAATCVDPTSIIAWTMLGLFYDAVPNEISAEMAYSEANKLNYAKAAALAEAARAEKEDVEKREKEKLAADKTEVMSDLADAGFTSKESELKQKTAPSVKTKPSVGKPVQNAQQKPPNERTTQIPTVVSEEEISTVEPPPVPATSIFMQAVNWLLEVKAVSFTERALGHELLTCSGPNIDFHIALARLRLQTGDYTEAEDSLNEALQIDFTNPDAWSLMGHVKYLKGDTATARQCYERTLSFVNDASETHSVYLRLASIYLHEKKYLEAKNTFLMACKRSPSCISWLGVGVSCYRLGELKEAEDALSEANMLNNNDPEVWAYLSLVCLQTNRCLQAEQAYKYAIKLNLEEGPLLAEIHMEQIAHGFGNPGF